MSNNASANPGEELSQKITRSLLIGVWIGAWAVAAIAFHGSMIVPILKLHFDGVTTEGRILELTKSYSSHHIGRSSTAFPNDVLVFKFKDNKGKSHEIRHFISDDFLRIVRERLKRQVDADGGSSRRISVRYLAATPDVAMPQEDIFVRKWPVFWFFIMFGAGIFCMKSLLKKKRER